MFAGFLGDATVAAEDDDLAARVQELRRALPRTRPTTAPRAGRRCFGAPRRPRGRCPRGAVPGPAATRSRDPCRPAPHPGPPLEGVVGALDEVDRRHARSLCGRGLRDARERRPGRPPVRRGSRLHGVLAARAAVDGSFAGPGRPGLDEVLYVLEGTGTVTVDGARHALGPGNAVFVAAGQSWSVAGADELTILSVLVHEPEPASSPFGVVDLAASERQSATAGRQFVLGAGPESGCESVTQFIGLIPPGRAPGPLPHLRRGDLRARRRRLSRDRRRAGAATRRLVRAPAGAPRPLPREHGGRRRCACSACSGPPGSPAEAYYPDGTLALPPERS